jgi:hypothetical protein
MERQWMIMAVIIANLVVLGLLVAFKTSKLRAAGCRSEPVSATRKLILGVVASIGLVLFVTLISIYFLRQSGS